MRPTITPIDDADEVNIGELTREDALDETLQLLKDATEDIRRIATGDYRSLATPDDIQKILNDWLNEANVTTHPDEKNITISISLTSGYNSNIAFDLETLLRDHLKVTEEDQAVVDSLRAFHQRLGEMLAKVP
jgi:uncharacterized protein YpuA (DUF1002 family)